MRRDPAGRYQTPGELAADLRRWLGHEPTVARPARVLRRVGLWAVRNKGWAAALVCSAVAAVALGGTAYAFEAKRASDAADAKKVAEAELALLKAAQSSSGVHEQAWSRRSWAMFDQVAQVRRDGEVRDLAAATLVGLDAELVKQLSGPKESDGTGASGIAYSRDGRYVLAGGAGKLHAWLWDSQTGREVHSPHPGEGPVGFTRDGRPIQVVLTATPDNEVSFLLWDVAGRKEVAKIPIAVPIGMQLAKASLSEDTALLSASFASGLEAGKGRVIVWESATGRLVRQIDRAATDVATSPDGKWLAAGSHDGRVTLWPLPVGDPLPPLACSRTAVQAVAFSPSVRRSDVGKQAASPTGRLAAGDAGGTVTVWDLDAMYLVSRCQGSHYGVHAVAFSPDGVTLASAGRAVVKVWNSATGWLLLDLPAQNWMNAVSFAPDGLGLAATGTGVFGGEGGLHVWRLEDGRGVRTFRGLEAQVAHAIVSPDGTWIAALSHNWQIGVWEMATGRLAHLLEVPVGRFPDNAGLAFDARGKRLGVSAGDYALLWDVAAGRLIDRWALPEGLCDKFAFHPDGQVLHLRWSHRPVRLPGGFRIRELQPGGKVREVKKLDEFRGRPEEAEATPDGRYFVVCGWEGAEEYKNPAPIQVFHSRTGEPLWPTPIRPGLHVFSMDPTGRLLRVRTKGDKPQFQIVETLTGRLVQADGHSSGDNLGPEGEYSAGFGASAGGNSAFQLYRKGREAPVVSIALEARSTSMARFTVDGRRVIWGNADGTVMVCDVPEVQRRLAGLGLGW
jgi:WD40 repeat protein